MQSEHSNIKKRTKQTAETKRKKKQKKKLKKLRKKPVSFDLFLRQLVLECLSQRHVCTALTPVFK